MLEKEDFSFLTSLEPKDLYDYIIDQGYDTVTDNETLKKLKVDDNKVHGCQSNVWVLRENNEWFWESNAFLVQGLINIMMSHIVTMTDDEIKNLSMDYFPFLCTTTLTAGRVNGMKSYIERIKQIVRED
jgi:cysteine desulfuration protein SufE